MLDALARLVVELAVELAGTRRLTQADFALAN